MAQRRPHRLRKGSMSTDMAIPEIVEGELVGQTNLFGTDDPAMVVQKATATADALIQVVKDKQLIKRIGQSDHVLVEAWTLLGAMLGVFPVCVWTRKLEDGWEARVEARTLSGAIVGAAEAECLRGERNWKSSDDYALRSMAQTRATSKALRAPLGFIVTLAGFNPTPAEEMPSLSGPGGHVTQGDPADVPTIAGAHETAPGPENEERRLALGTLESVFKHAKEHGSLPPGHENWDAYLKWYVEGRLKMGLPELRTKATVPQLNELAAYIQDMEIAF